MQYHAILVRPTFARFMAVPHYAYLMLKMPEPKGVIMVKGDFDHSDRCDIEFSKISQCFGMQEQLEEASLDNNMTIFPVAKKPTYGAAYNATNATTDHQVHPTDPRKTVRGSSSLHVA